MPATETTKDTKKKTTPRRRTKKIDVLQAEKEKDEAVAEAIARARQEWEQQQEEEGFEDIDDFETDDEAPTFGLFGGHSHAADEEGLRSLNKEEAEFNIFDYIEENYFRVGTPVVYYVKKNGQVMGEVEHPASWTQLQETYGGGHYQVIAKTAEDKRYIKAQRQMVAAPNKKPEIKDERIIIPPAPTPQAVGPDVNQMFEGMLGMFQQMQAMNERARTREERDEKKSSDAVNTQFFTLMQAQTESSNKMFMEVAKLTQETAKAQSENFSKVIEKMDDKFTRMFEKLSDSSNKKDQLGLAELLALVSSSRNEGLEQMKMIMEIAEAKAAEKDDDDDGDSKESLLQTLIKGVVPLMAQAGRAPAPQHQVPQQRRSLPQSGGVNTQAPGGQRPVARGAAPRGQAPVAHPQARGQVQTPGQAGGGEIKRAFTAQSLGLPSFVDEDEVKTGTPTPEEIAAMNPVIIGPGLEDTTEGLETQEEGEGSDVRDGDIYENATPAQRTIAEIAAPSIVVYLNDKEVGPRDVAAMVLKDLEAQGFTPDVVVREFTFDFLIAITRSFGVGDDKAEWFGEFYGELEKRAGIGTDGNTEPSTGEPVETATRGEGQL